MKRVLHLFRAEKPTVAFIDLMNNFQDEHVFWIFGEAYENERNKCLKYKNVKYYPRIDIKMHKRSTETELQQFDMIIYHGVFENVIIEYFYTHKKLLQKLVLYFWGGDKEHFDKWKKEKKYIINNAAVIATIIPQDYEDLKKYCRPKGKHLCAKYNGDAVFEIIDKISDISKDDNTVLNIQVGNSATFTNNHFEILQFLSKFKEENIRVYVPLSYGDMDYAEKVVTYGKKIFGDKFVPMQKFMPLEEYCKFEYKMDIGIFGMKRQQALGNIIALMLVGCKIYFDQESLLWDFFVKDSGCIITDMKQIHDMNFKEFAEFSTEDMLFNRALVRKKFDTEESIKGWKAVFDSF